MALRTSTSWDGTAGSRRSARASRPAGRAGSRGHPSPGGSRRAAGLSDRRRAASPCTAPRSGAGRGGGVRARAAATAAAAAASRREPGGLGPVRSSRPDLEWARTTGGARERRERPAPARPPRPPPRPGRGPRPALPGGGGGGGGPAAARAP